MKHYKSYFSLFISMVMLVVFIAGCGDKKTAGEADTSDVPFTFSNDIDENGYWHDVIALDYVTLPDYDAIAIPSEKHAVTDEQVQTALDSLLKEYVTTEQVKDRAVKDKDNVNIDYVGSVDGVEFSGGSTGGAGTDVTAGSMDYIDDFLVQIIGHKPGETINVEVTFPDEYPNNPNLEGKDAVFVTTINYISNKISPELTDAFVKEKLSAQYGWNTVEETKNGVRTELQKSAIRTYLREYLVDNTTAKSVPDRIMKHQENSMIKYYQDSAESYGMDVNAFISAQEGFSSMDELVEAYSESNANASKLSLANQAIAEKSKISVSNDEVKKYCSDIIGADYSQVTERYGIPYITQMTLYEKVFNHLFDHAVLK